MLKRLGKSIAENTLEGAAQGFGIAVGDQIRPIVENVRVITDDVRELGERLDRMENDILAIKELLQERLPEPRKRKPSNLAAKTARKQAERARQRGE